MKATSRYRLTFYNKINKVIKINQITWSKYNNSYFYFKKIWNQNRIEKVKFLKKKEENIIKKIILNNEIEEVEGNIKIIEVIELVSN